MIEQRLDFVFSKRQFDGLTKDGTNARFFFFEIVVEAYHVRVQRYFSERRQRNRFVGKRNRTFFPLRAVAVRIEVERVRLLRKCRRLLFQLAFLTYFQTESIFMPAQINIAVKPCFVDNWQIAYGMRAVNGTV